MKNVKNENRLSFFLFIPTFLTRDSLGSFLVLVYTLNTLFHHLTLEYDIGYRTLLYEHHLAGTRFFYDQKVAGTIAQIQRGIGHKILGIGLDGYLDGMNYKMCQRPQNVLYRGNLNTRCVDVLLGAQIRPANG